MHVSRIDEPAPFLTTDGSTIRELAGRALLCCCAPPWTAEDTVLTGG